MRLVLASYWSLKSSIFVTRSTIRANITKVYLNCYRIHSKQLSSTQGVEISGWFNWSLWLSRLYGILLLKFTILKPNDFVLLNPNSERRERDTGPLNYFIFILLFWKERDLKPVYERKKETNINKSILLNVNDGHIVLYFNSW